MNEPVVTARESEFKFHPKAREISGFGGGYEQTCRNMVIAGAEFFKQNPDANPEYQGFKNVYGLIKKSNDDAEKLDAVLMEACFNDCTGAMHQAVINHVLFIAKNGWEKYQKELCKQQEKKNA